MDITKDYSGLCLVIAKATHKAMLDNFPLIRNIPVEHWHFFVSVLAFRLMDDIMKTSQLSFEKQEQATARSCAKLVEEYPAFLQGVAALRKYLENYDVQEITPDELCMWLTANLFGKNATELSGQELEVGKFTINIIVRHLSGIQVGGAAGA